MNLRPNTRQLIPVVLLIAQLAVGIFFGVLLQPPISKVADLNIPGVVECKPLPSGGFETNCIDRNDRLIRSYLRTMKPEPATPADQGRLLALPGFLLLGIAVFATTWKVFGLAGVACLAVVYAVGRVAGALNDTHVYLTVAAWLAATILLWMLHNQDQGRQTPGRTAL